MSVQDQMQKILGQAFNPDFLEIKNQSHLHAGHAGDDGSGESHFKIKISSSKFNGINRLERQRMIYKALGDIMHKIHALSIEVIENQ